MTSMHNEVVPNRFKIKNRQEGLAYLSFQIDKLVRAFSKPRILFVSDYGDDSNEIEQYLISQDVFFHKTTTELVLDISQDEASRFSLILAGFFDLRKLSILGNIIVPHPFLSEKPFEFAIVSTEAYTVLNKHDWQENASFISPLLGSETDFFSIYEYSLSLFERKCQIRDYLDLCQLLEDVIDRGIEGDIAEFGSLNGHSGFLIASVMEALSSRKTFYMFDLFGEEAQENIGVDLFWNKIWNQSNRPFFDEIRSKFTKFDNVRFIKGDFTKTFPKTSSINKLSLVYVDCDSYRGTKFLLETLYDKHLSKHGVMIIEDYGHGPLLGNRIAFHEFFDKRTDCFKFFSQFSGFQIVVKLTDN